MLERPVALVTGSSRGIGRGIAECLGTLGHAVIINYVRNAPAAEAARGAVEQAGGVAMLVRADVSERHDRARLVEETMAHFGRIDILVNNAGIPVPSRVDLLEATEANWELILNTNLRGPYFLTQAVAREMIRLKQEGLQSRRKIINISSVSAYAVSTNRGEYCVAKAGMTMMTRLYAERLAEHDIGVFEIRPGIIESDMTDPVRQKYDRLIAEGIMPIRRWGRPSDVAKAVAALVQDYFPYSTGEVLNVDGGFHLHRL